MKILIALAPGLDIPPEHLEGALHHYGLVPYIELVLTETGGNLNRSVDKLCGHTKMRTLFSSDRAREAAEYSDKALFIWDGRDPYINNLRNWFHFLGKPYYDWTHNDT